MVALLHTDTGKGDDKPRRWLTTQKSVADQRCGFVVSFLLSVRV